MAGGTIQQLLNGAVIRQRGQVRSFLGTDRWRCRQMNLSWQKDVRTDTHTLTHMDACFQKFYSPALLSLNRLFIYFQNDDDDEDDDYDDSSSNDDDEDEGNALQSTTYCVHCTAVYRGMLCLSAFCFIIFRSVRSSMSIISSTSLFEQILCVQMTRMRMKMRMTMMKIRPEILAIKG
jgi:hypothetical protein